MPKQQTRRRRPTCRVSRFCSRLSIRRWRITWGSNPDEDLARNITEGLVDYTSIELQQKENQGVVADLRQEFPDWEKRESATLAEAEKLLAEGMGDLNGKELLELAYLQVEPVQGYGGPNMQKIFRKAVLAEKRKQGVKK
jgi:hypothetical protein